ncbi:phytanoyl dioxygenase family [Naviculisporaceae sp. PSN 640]
MPALTLQDLPQVEEFTPDPSNVDAVVQSLARVGGVVIRGLVPQPKLDLIERDVRPYLDADTPWVGDFFPPETRRAFGLVGKSDTFTRCIPMDPLYQAVCDRILKSTYQAYTGQKLETSVSHPQLNNTIVFSIGPGARAQELHRDDMIHHNMLKAINADEWTPDRETGIGFFIAGKKTTKANGATRFIPGSHLWDTLTPPDEDLAVYAELNPGDAFIMLSSCFHGGSANTTKDEERLIYSCFMTRGYLRQEENQYLAVPIEKVRELPEDVQRMMGYRVSHPFLGWLDLEDPVKAVYGKDWKKPETSDLY